MPNERDQRESLRFTTARKNRGLENAFKALNEKGRADIMERAMRVATTRLSKGSVGPASQLIGFRLAVLRARNEILDEEVGEVHPPEEPNPHHEYWRPYGSL